MTNTQENNFVYLVVNEESGTMSMYRPEDAKIAVHRFIVMYEDLFMAHKQDKKDDVKSMERNLKTYVDNPQKILDELLRTGDFGYFNDLGVYIRRKFFDNYSY